MTDTTRLALALNELAAALLELTSGGAGGSTVPLQSPSSPPASAAPSTLGQQASPAAAAFANAQPAPQNGGSCPVHQIPFTFKEGGISTKTGKPYKGFFKCDGKDADGNWCQERP
jgi:hypothetical protein